MWKDRWGFRFELGKSAFLNSGCRVTYCLITVNNSLNASQQVWCFCYSFTNTVYNPWFLKDRRPDQMFVMFTTEPPIHMPNLDKFENFFNWTMTYRTGSTFQLKYGEIVPLETAPSTHIPVWIQLKEKLNWLFGWCPTVTPEAIDKDTSKFWKNT